MSVPEQIKANFDLSVRTNAEILNATNGETVTVRREFRANERTMYAKLGAADGEAILATFEAAAADDANPNQAAYKRASRWMLPSEDGVDMANPETRAMADGLSNYGATAEQIAAVKALANTKITVAERDYGRRITIADIETARRKAGS